MWNVSGMDPCCRDLIHECDCPEVDIHCAMVEIDQDNCVDRMSLYLLNIDDQMNMVWVDSVDHTVLCICLQYLEDVCVSLLAVSTSSYYLSGCGRVYL